MTPLNQQEFIHRIKTALGRPPAGSQCALDLFGNYMSDETRALLQRIKNRTAAERQKLLGTLMEAAGPINVKAQVCEDARAAAAAIARLVRAKAPEWGEQKSVVAWKHPLIERLNLPDTLSEQGVSVFFTDLASADEDSLRRRVMNSYIGITSADFCMADTATLVMRTRPGQARSVSLLPSIHIAVVELSRMIADLKELYALLKWDGQEKKEGVTNCMTFISGPSKTADIEATMVHGAHGPREVYVYVIAEKIAG